MLNKNKLTAGMQKILHLGVVFSLLCVSLLPGVNTASAAQISSATASASPSTTSTSETTYTVTFTPTTALTSSGSKFTITFPSQYTTSFAALVDADVSVSGTNITGSVETFDDTQNRITSTIATSGSVTTPITITIGDTAGALNDLTNPSTSGVYGLGIDTYSPTDELIDQGIAYASIGGTVSVTAVVTEALIMTLSNSSVNLRVDPSVNNGQDKSQSTAITVSSNAASGYSISGALDNADVGADNRLKNGTNYIAAYPNSSENYFGYKAYNDTLPGSPASAENAFASSSTAVYTDAGSTALGCTGASCPSNSRLHYVNYDLNVDYLTPAGQYAGTITYTVAGSF